MKEKLKWKQEGENIIINIPSKFQNKAIGKYATTFKISL
jgi:hypothetical protein